SHGTWDLSKNCVRSSRMQSFAKVKVTFSDIFRRSRFELFSNAMRRYCIGATYPFPEQYISAPLPYVRLSKRFVIAFSIHSLFTLPSAATALSNMVFLPKEYSSPPMSETQQSLWLDPTP